MLVALAWRNLWRQKRRTLLSLFSIAFASSLMVFLLSFQLGVYAQMKESALKLLDGYAQLQARGYRDDPDIRKTIAHVELLRRQALGIAGVSAAAPRINAFAILANGERSYGALIVGVDPTVETKISSLGNTVQRGRYFVGTDSDAAVIGDTLARNLGLSVGQKVTLLGSAADGSVAADVLRVIGIFHSGIQALDRDLLEMPFARAQETFGLEGRAHIIAISGPTLSGVNSALPQLDAIGRRSGLVLQDWGALEPALRDSITLKYITSSLLYITLVIVVTFIILNTLLMSVLERTREFGVLLAIGMRPSAIGAMVWLELIFLSLLGSAIGIAIGAGLSLWFMHYGISLAGLADVLARYGLPTRLYPALSALSAIAGPGALVLAICIGGFVPYAHIRRLQAAAAMRTA
jgi:ABC-type lipoprotein release transport system permease subunit